MSHSAYALARSSCNVHVLMPLYNARSLLCIFWPRRSFRDDHDEVVSPEDDGPDAPDIDLLRFFRVLEDHVHVIVVSDELAFEDPVVLEEQLDALVDRFF